MAQAVFRSDEGAGTAIVEYRGPSSLRQLCDRFGFTLFDRITKIRFGKVDYESLDLNMFSHLETVKANWILRSADSDEEKWAIVNETELGKKLKESFSDCQMKVDESQIQLDRTATCALLPLSPAGH